MNKRVVFRVALLAGLILLGAVGIGYRDQFNAQQLEAWIVQLGPWAPVAYILAWLIAPVAFLPGSPLTLTGGVLFGPLWGTVYTIFGATGGATIAFLMARYLAGSWVERNATGILGRVKHGVEHEGWRFVAFTRLVPLFPFNLLNYALGLTNISLRSYIIATFFCMLPGSAGYSYLGYAGRELLAGEDHTVRTLLVAVAVVAALVLLPLMVRRWRAENSSSSPVASNM